MPRVPSAAIGVIVLPARTVGAGPCATGGGPDDRLMETLDRLARGPSRTRGRRATPAAATMPRWRVPLGSAAQGPRRETAPAGAATDVVMADLAALAAQLDGEAETLLGLVDAAKTRGHGARSAIS